MVVANDGAADNIPAAKTEINLSFIFFFPLAKWFIDLFRGFAGACLSYLGDASGRPLLNSYIQMICARDVQSQRRVIGELQDIRKKSQVCNELAR
jgi:hypothetical protein